MYFSFRPPEQKAVGLKQFRATFVRQTIDALVAQRYRDRVAAVMDATGQGRDEHLPVHGLCQRHPSLRYRRPLHRLAHAAIDIVRGNRPNRGSLPGHRPAGDSAVVLLTMRQPLPSAEPDRRPTT